MDQMILKLDVQDCIGMKLLLLYLFIIILRWSIKYSKVVRKLNSLPS